MGRKKRRSHGTYLCQCEECRTQTPPATCEETLDLFGRRGRVKQLSFEQTAVKRRPRKRRSR